MPPARLAGEVAAYDDQAAALAEWAAALPADAWDDPSVLPGWSVRTLVAHCAGSKDGLATHLATRADGPATPVGSHVTAYRVGAADITAQSEQIGRTTPVEELLAGLRRPTPVPPRADADVVAGPRGPITALDFARTRTLDLVVHCDDASRSRPDADPVELRRPALAAAARVAATILTQQAPGRSVEVRVPPFVAVQAVAGPRHTRGTPPNTVETDAVTWLRLATGRVGFAEALADGRVQATGARGDLTPYLPLLS
ncbi:sterol carrier family protein [Jatrophihabitans sp. YIM 134969]